MYLCVSVRCALVLVKDDVRMMNELCMLCTTLACVNDINKVFDRKDGHLFVVIHNICGRLAKII